MKSSTSAGEKLPDWFNMNLSELVENSLKHGVVPVFNFFGKDKVAVFEEPKCKPFEETPVMILEKEVKRDQRLIKRLEGKDGIDPSTPDEKLKPLIRKLKKKIRKFQSAIDFLNQKP